MTMFSAIAPKSVFVHFSNLAMMSLRNRNIVKRKADKTASAGVPKKKHKNATTVDAGSGWVIPDFMNREVMETTVRSLETTGFSVIQRAVEPANKPVLIISLTSRKCFA
jgi:hypothetical protein